MQNKYNDLMAETVWLRATLSDLDSRLSASALLGLTVAESYDSFYQAVVADALKAATPTSAAQPVQPTKK